MDSSDKLKSIWRGVSTRHLPSSEEMAKTITDFRDKKLRQKYLVIVCSLCLSSLLVAILFFTPFKMLITYLGGGLMASSGVILAITNIRSLKRFRQLNNCSNHEFLNFLRQTQKNQLFYYGKTQPAIITLNGIGLAFYSYELVIKDVNWFLPAFIMCICYITIMWFVVRPRMYKRGAKKLSATIAKIESINKQLE